MDGTEFWKNTRALRFEMSLLLVDTVRVTGESFGEVSFLGGALIFPDAGLSVVGFSVVGFSVVFSAVSFRGVVASVGESIVDGGGTMLTLGGLLSESGVLGDNAATCFGRAGFIIEREDVSFDRSFVDRLRLNLKRKLRLR
jgi:hypothetical protein